jgi:hypothetical protein
MSQSLPPVISNAGASFVKVLPYSVERQRTAGDEGPRPATIIVFPDGEIAMAGSPPVSGMIKVSYARGPICVAGLNARLPDDPAAGAPNVTRPSYRLAPAYAFAITR